MQISKQHLSGAKSPALVRLRLLDLNEHIGNGEDFVRGVDDTGTGPQVGLIGETGFGTRALFDHHLMAGTEQFVRARGYESYAVFVNFDLLRYADPHRASNLESALGGAQPVQIWILRMIRLDRVRRLLRGLKVEPPPDPHGRQSSIFYAAQRARQPNADISHTHARADRAGAPVR